MEISEVADILGVCHALRFIGLPKHIFVTNERVKDSKSGTYFRGLQPKSRGDAIFLSADADETTVPHEVWHALTGMGELSAYPVGKVMAMKYQILKKLPRLKGLLSRPVRYKEITGSKDFPNAQKYGKRVRQFVLVR